MNILITGINGFLGRNLVDSFSNHNLYGFDIDEGKIGDVHVFASSHLADIDMAFDMIIMCHAAVASGVHTPGNDVLYDVNVKLTESILRKFPESSIVFISSASIYDSSLDIISEESKEKPTNNYSISKLWGEHLVISSNRGVALRLSSMFGKGMKENTLIPTYVMQALETDEINVWGDGMRLQNYIHVTDVAQYIIRIIHNFNNCEGKVLLGVAPQEHTNTVLAEIIASRCNVPIRSISEDHSLSLKYNNKLTTSLLKYNPTLDFENQLIEYIEWKKNA